VDGYTLITQMNISMTTRSMRMMLGFAGFVGIVLVLCEAKGHILIINFRWLRSGIVNT